MPGCSDSDSNHTATGTFVDSAVIGIEYQTPTQSGFTNERAEFHYQPGEQVTFKIGDLVLGTTPGGEMITPVDLVAGATGTDDQTVKNLLVFLQSLDADSDPSNGIEITVALRQAVAAAGSALDFDTDSKSFASALDGFIQEIGHEGALIGEQQAVDNFLAAMDAMGEYWAGGLYASPDPAVFLSEADQAGNGYGYFQDIYASDGDLEAGEFIFRTFCERYFSVLDVYGILGPSGESFFSVSMTNAELDFALAKAVGVNDATLSGDYGIVVFTPQPEPYSAYIEVSCDGSGAAAGSVIAQSDGVGGDPASFTYSVQSDGTLRLNVLGELYRGAVAQDGDLFFFVGENSDGAPEMGVGIRRDTAAAGDLSGLYYAGVLLRGDYDGTEAVMAFITALDLVDGYGPIYGCSPSVEPSPGAPDFCAGDDFFTGDLDCTVSNGTIEGTSTADLYGGGSEAMNGALSSNGNYFVMATTSGAYPGIVIGIKDTYAWPPK
ncbi:MAG TPA: hypothetical protein ACFCUC_08605 [Desulfobacterales bacterium]